MQLIESELEARPRKGIAALGRTRLSRICPQDGVYVKQTNLREKPGKQTSLSVASIGKTIIFRSHSSLVTTAVMALKWFSSPGIQVQL